ncbi:MAG: CDP-glycerol glycerophosphotransferase family protein [Pseudomonadota bacterium]
MSGTYYFTVQAYMASNVLPIYREMGGTFLLKNLTKWWQFKRYLKTYGNREGERTLFDTPRAKIFNPEQKTGIAGTVLSATTAPLLTSEDLVRVFVGHGTGDKKYPNQNIDEVFGAYNYVFLTGEKQRQKMIDSDVRVDEAKLVNIGNTRFDQIVNKDIDREQVLRERGISDACKDRKILLYAPTWRWGNGTLQKYALKFARELSRDYFLIIRPHAHDRSLIGKLKRDIANEKIEHVYVSNPSDVVKHDTMVDFAIADLLISDVSSIIYDFLITNKPIVTIDNGFADKHDMPEHLDISSVSTTFREADQIASVVQSAIEGFGAYQNDYQKMLNDVFYFNDGKSVERATTFLKGLAVEV